MSMSSYDLGIPGSCLKLRCEVACRLRCGLACMILTEGFTSFGFKVSTFSMSETILQKQDNSSLLSDKFV